MNVDFKAKTATVSMQDGLQLAKEACDRAFEGTSYSVASFAVN